MALKISPSNPYRGMLVLAVAGELDLATAETLREALTDAVKSTDVDAVLIDLEALTFLDSTGIGVLVAGWRSATDSGKVMRVDKAHGMALEVLRITGVWPHLSGEADAR
jgi:anti-sigma B factor antagonist